MFSPVGINGHFPFVPHSVGMQIQFPNATQNQSPHAESGVNREVYRTLHFSPNPPIIVSCLPLTVDHTGAWDDLLSNLVEQPQLSEQAQHFPTQISEEQQRNRDVGSADQDALAQTAGKLVEALREEQNPKFKNSQFMGLMRSLADRTSVVDGNDIVLATSAPESTASTSADVKGKVKERADTISTFDQTVQIHPHPTHIGAISGQQQSSSSSVQGQTSDAAITQDSFDEVYEYFKRENEDYIAYQQAMNTVIASDAQGVSDESSQQLEWDKLQSEWDAWEANAVGVRKMSNYQFAVENPYLLGSSTRVHDMHSSFDQVGALMPTTGAVDGGP